MSEAGKRFEARRDRNMGVGAAIGAGAGAAMGAAFLAAGPIGWLMFGCSVINFGMTGACTGLFATKGRHPDH